jgi:two-component system sensor histidine kinase ChvG
MTARRSARTLVAVGCLLLILLPLFFLGFAYAYEAVVVRGIRRDLQALEREVAALARPAALAAPGGQAALHAGVRRGGALAYVLGRDGSIVLQTDTAPEAMDASLIGTLAERLLGGLWLPAPAAGLDQLERELGPLSARPEVQAALGGRRAAAVRRTPSGQAVLVQLAAPLDGGLVLYLCRGSRRGLRQLFLVRHELLKLILYQSVFALLFGLFLSRHLLLPMERMSRAARRYPREPLGDAQILSRNDELGELARAIHALAADLESRRQATAELGADVAHEFKNPLATIAASVELLGSRAEGASPERVKLVAEHIQEAVGRLRRSLDALFSLLQLEATLKDEPLEEVAYAELLADILADYRRDPRYADFTLQLCCAAELGMVRMVPHRWEEALRNLLDNALLQPAARREVVVAVSRQGDEVVTTVRDYGPGVSAGNRDKIFRRFFSQRPPGTAPGTGLGLSIVQAVATAHGGRVEVRTPADGPGALFVLTMRS